MQDNRVVAVLLKDIIQNNLELNFAQQFIVFWLLTFKSQILINALLASEAAFWMHNTIALMIVCLATNIAFALSKWVREQVVKLFLHFASVVRVTI